ncbi:acrosin-like [Neopelma chrysocephalum]|uniref:acrosin-like n=1 Tax=Neopelma chrysocephalum TaxID=114329 RepID=UPI000FCCF9E5|nr:acrosin-like [Neopelma chrysocephalum]XP_027565467.1 acrosin-like [Neopelma chrysocephalum]
MILLRLLILLALCRAATSNTCGQVCGLRPVPYSTTRIVGGVNVPPGTGAWAGIVSIQSIRTEKWSSHKCGGTIIRPKWVLSAAHCFINRTNPLSEWAVLAGIIGTAEVGPHVQLRRIKQVQLQELYDGRGRLLHDIALLELEQPFECTPSIQLACLPGPTVTLSPLNCYVAGWGSTQAKTVASQGSILKEAKVLLIDTQLCNSSDWYGGLLLPGNLCAGYEKGGVSTCKGDSGGPLICKDGKADIFWEIGLTSYGIGCARAKKPTVFVSTQYYYNWIMKHIGQSPATPAPVQPCPFPHKKLQQFFDLLQELLKFVKAATA